MISQTLYITRCEFESLSDDGVLQVGDWHHLKIHIQCAASTSTTDSHQALYRLVAHSAVWELSVNSSGTYSVINDCSSMTVYNLPGVLDTALVLDAIDYLLKLLYKNFGLDGFHFAEALLLYCLVFYSQFALCNLSFMQQNRLLYTSREHTVCTGVCRCIVENVKKKAVCEIACTCHLTSFVSLWVISGFASASEQDPCSHLTYKCVNVCRCCGVKQ